MAVNLKDAEGLLKGDATVHGQPRGSLGRADALVSPNFEVDEVGLAC